MTRRGLTQSEVAAALHWNQAKLNKIMMGRVALTVDALDMICHAIGFNLCEAVRDRGMEFSAEMTPTELRTLEVMRALPEQVRDAYLKLLSVSQNDTHKP